MKRTLLSNVFIEYKFKYARIICMGSILPESVCNPSVVLHHDRKDIMIG